MWEFVSRLFRTGSTQSTPVFHGDHSILLHDIFDVAKGWNIPPAIVPVSKGVNQDGNPYYVVLLGGISITVFEITMWQQGVVRNTVPRRLVALTTFPGVKITAPEKLLSATYETKGWPSFGLGESKTPTMQTAIPIAEGFPVDLARKQLMVCLGILAEEAIPLNKAWSGSTGSQQQTGKIPAIIGEFLGAFVGEIFQG